MSMSWVGDGCSGVGCGFSPNPDDDLFSGDSFSDVFLSSEDDWWSIGHSNDGSLSNDWNADVESPVKPTTFWHDSSDVHFPFDNYDQGPIRTDETTHNSFGSQTLVISILFLAVVVVIFLIRFLHCAKRDDEPNDDENNNEELPSVGSGGSTRRVAPINQTNAAVAAARRKKSADMPLEKRMELYSEAFNRNQNQMILDESAIVLVEQEPGKGLKQDRSIKQHRSCDEDSYCSILRQLESMQALRRSIPDGTTLTIERKSYSSSTPAMNTNGSRIDMAGDRKNCIIEEDLDETVIIFENTDTDSVTDSDSDSDSVVSRKDPPRENSNIVHPRCIPVSDGGDVEDGTMVVPRTCVICFEEMKPAEMIVWSETESCPHVYHKDCIVSFFAHKKQNARQLGLDHNPCPTCRQSFVTVCGRAAV